MDVYQIILTALMFIGIIGNTIVAWTDWIKRKQFTKGFLIGCAILNGFGIFALIIWLITHK